MQPNKNTTVTKPNQKIEKEIERFIKYIRRMNSVEDDQQLDFLLTAMYNKNTDTYTSIGIDIPGHIQFIRRMAMYTDDQLKHKLREQYGNNIVFQDIFENSSKKRAIKEMNEAAKDYKSDPTSFARKVDAEFRR